MSTSEITIAPCILTTNVCTNLRVRDTQGQGSNTNVHGRVLRGDAPGPKELRKVFLPGSVT